MSVLLQISDPHFGTEQPPVVQALEAPGWNKNRASQLLRLKRTTLVEKIRAKGIAAPDSDLPPLRPRA